MEWRRTDQTGRGRAEGVGCGLCLVRELFTMASDLPIETRVTSVPVLLPSLLRGPEVLRRIPFNGISALSPDVPSFDDSRQETPQTTTSDLHQNQEGSLIPGENRGGSYGTGWKGYVLARRGLSEPSWGNNTYPESNRQRERMT